MVDSRRLGSAFLLLLLGCTCAASTNPIPGSSASIAHAEQTPATPEQLAASAKPAPPTRLSPADLLSTHETLRRAAHAYAIGDVEEATQWLASPALPESDLSTFLKARVLSARDQDAEALALLESVAEGDSVLAPYAKLLAAEQQMANGQPGRAVALLQDLPASWPEAKQADRMRWIAQAVHAPDDDTVPHLRALVGELADTDPGTTLTTALAQLLERDGRVEALKEAIGLYRRIRTRRPLYRSSTEAQAREAALLERLPPSERRTLAGLSADDRLALGESYLRAARYEQAGETLRPLTRDASLSPSLRCSAGVALGKAFDGARNRSEAGEVFERFAGDCEDEDTQARARYLAGKAFYRAGDNPRAEAILVALATSQPAHRLADDALRYAAFAAKEQGDEARFKAHLASIVTRPFPGDMRAEAAFELGYDAIKADNFAEAIRWFGEVKDDRRAAEGAEGRFAYWYARALEGASRTDEATDQFYAVCQHHPLSLYGQMALKRLGALAPARAAQVKQAWTRARPSAPTLDFAQRSEFASPALQRAVALMKVGEASWAFDELQTAGWFGEGGDAGLQWFGAALFNEADLTWQSIRLMRQRLRHFRKSAPTGDAKPQWELAYPRPFKTHVERAATEQNLPPELVYAIAREESNFYPKAKSPANAFGLVQLIEPTARTWGRKVGLTVERRDLLVPEANLRIGARFMRYLMDRFDERIAAVPAGYNAGPAAAARWLKAAPGITLDHWLEAIPYAETQKYTRRVLQSYSVYHFLQHGELVNLPERL